MQTTVNKTTVLLLQFPQSEGQIIIENLFLILFANLEKFSLANRRKGATSRVQMSS